MRVSNNLTVNYMLVNKHGSTEHMLYKYQEHQYCEQTFGYVVYSTHLLLQR